MDHSYDNLFRNDMCLYNTIPLTTTKSGKLFSAIKYGQCDKVIDIGVNWIEIIIDEGMPNIVSLFHSSNILLYVS